jgi:hypothetical protein
VAEQELVLLEIQERVEEFPAVIVAGSAFKDTEGTGMLAGTTVTVVEAVLEPLLPVQVIAYSVVVAGETI